MVLDACPPAEKEPRAAAARGTVTTAVESVLWTLRPLLLALLTWALLFCAGALANTNSAAPTCGPNQSCPPSGGGSGGGNGGQPPNGCNGNPNGNPGCNGSGNPVNVLNGNKYQLEIDLAALPGDLGLSFSRHYNSHSRHRGLTGIGWRSSVELMLLDGADDVQIIDADGTRRIFAKGARGSVCTSARPQDGRVLIDEAADARPERRRFRWPRLDGSEFLFSDGGRFAHPLQAVRAANGAVLTLHYTGGALDRLVDPQGRVLQFVYASAAKAPAGARDRALMLAALDTPVGRIAYRYDAQGRLTEVTQPNGLRRLYHYEAEHQAGDPWLLTGISVAYADAGPALPVAAAVPVAATTATSAATATSAKTAASATAATAATSEKTTPATTAPAANADLQTVRRLSTYVYDSRGRAVRTTHVNGEDLRLQYDEGTGGSTGTTGSTVGSTTITPLRGARRDQPTVYRHRDLLGQRVMLSATGPGCGQCPPSNVRYEYTALGQVSAVITLDAQGKPMQTTRTAFDSVGRPLRVMQDEAGTAASARSGQHSRLLLRAEYAPLPTTAEADKLSAAAWATLWRPRLLARPSVIPGQEHQLRVHWNAFMQPVRAEETGYSPLDAQGRLSATSIERSRQFSYQVLSGVSRLTAVDGPLPGAEDSTRYHYDERGRLRLIQHPVVDLQERFAYDAAGRLTLHVPMDAVAVRHALKYQRGICRRASASSRVHCQRAARRAWSQSASGATVTPGGLSFKAHDPCGCGYHQQAA